jgi:cytochrome d ubiquinol oxidase subunit II
MTSATILLAVMWIGMTAYILFAGADFGGGFWDLFAGDPQHGRRIRSLIEHALGPVWETNHVWLIFVLVVLWTGFSPAFAAVMSTLYIPLTAAALGIIARGSAFAFRKASTQLWQQRLFGATFAFSSVVTPYFLGTVAGAIASGRVPLGLARGDIWSSWWNPTSTVTGVLAVAVCAYLAAVYLTHDAERSAPELAEGMRRRALGAGVAAGILSALGLLVLARDAPTLFRELTGGPAGLLTVASALCGLASLALLVTRRYVAVRITAAATVTAVLWAWAIGQYPLILPPRVTISDVQSTPAVLDATLIALAAGAVLLVPSLVWLYTLFQHEEPVPPQPAGAPGPAPTPDLAPPA